MERGLGGFMWGLTLWGGQAMFGQGELLVVADQHNYTISFPYIFV